MKKTDKSPCFQEFTFMQREKNKSVPTQDYVIDLHNLWICYISRKRGIKFANWLILAWNGKAYQTDAITSTLISEGEGRKVRIVQ
jgi:hypothetical protein